MDNALGPDEWIARLATLPLIDQPGAGFHYGLSTDLLGFLIARLEDASLGAVLERRIFRPLGMRDTGFIVPREKRARRAGLCGFDADGKLTALTTTPGGHALAERPDDMTFESGGQGLWSTVDDYLAFARIFVGGGEVDGVRLLRPETCAMMASNQLTPDQRRTARMFGMPLFAAGHGYGMGVAVVMEPDKADPLRCRGGVGTVGWPGAYGGWWQADPSDDSVLIFLTHNMLELQQMASGIGLDVWSAIAKFHELASALHPNGFIPAAASASDRRARRGVAGIQAASRQAATITSEARRIGHRIGDVHDLRRCSAPAGVAISAVASAAASPAPASSPYITGRVVCDSINCVTCRGEAPSAIRTPISLVRCSTRYDSTLNSPDTVSNRASPPSIERHPEGDLQEERLESRDGPHGHDRRPCSDRSW